MKKKFNPFKNLQLDPYEQEIEDALERGEIKEHAFTVKEKQEYADAATYTLNRMKKDARINIRLKRNDLNSIQQKASESGLPYQTLISTLLHHFAVGKITITL
jgi:predicted DNA binding CopG/RHH family protein